ncbi:MAG TPA: hypothetical protein VNO22_00825, partial [Planctomycetota bacterium]|nr:hypothetical protein [Planctomycetota bacterium]
MPDKEDLTYANIEGRLLAMLPEFRAAYGEWLEKYDSGLPHCVFGTLTQFVVEEYRRGATGPGTPFDRALCFLEEAMGSKDPEVQNLVWVSFLENLDAHAGEDFEGIKAKLGPKLRATLKK